MENDDMKKLREIQIDLVKRSVKTSDDVIGALKALSVLSKHVDDVAISIPPEKVAELTKAEDIIHGFLKKIVDDLERQLDDEHKTEALLDRVGYLTRALATCENIGELIIENRDYYLDANWRWVENKIPNPYFEELERQLAAEKDKVARITARVIELERIVNVDAQPAEHRGAEKTIRERAMKLREIQLDLVKRSVTSWPGAKDDVDEASKALSVLSKHADNEALDLAPETVSTLTKAEDTLTAFFKKLGDDLEKHLVYQVDTVKFTIHGNGYTKALIVVVDKEKEAFEKLNGIEGTELVFDGFERLTGLPVFKFDPDYCFKKRKVDSAKKGK